MSTRCGTAVSVSGRCEPRGVGMATAVTSAVLQSIHIKRSSYPTADISPI